MSRVFDYLYCNFEYIKSYGGIVYLDATNSKNKIYENSLYEDLVVKKDAYVELSKEEFLLHKILIIPMEVDQVLLYENRQQLQKFLELGGVLLSFTQIYLDWLPIQAFYIPSSVPIKERDIVTTEHFITQGVKDYDLSYRRGVKGFFSRGFMKAPCKAEIFLKDSEGECVAFIDSASTKGAIIVSAGADLLGFGLFENSTAKRLGLNLLLWVENYLQRNMPK
ncbi:hypothetical protein OQH60_06975 [Campylobacter sp. MIT 21-1685]|uniref:hypothetical protein n=1 Tax=unclassified Campylobacter TaxID=2593542 RepID=UPI00224A4F0A|nr:MULTISPECIES: hypothetical protein [unclassified Campylobacter]MCX2683607.1 hypothetical protein [Campylobacter sp. MIT 21-1684]MCX2751890.1 hypothetical protein [Campylobacter sp. MIT 21-1682]MCX2808091.1 hypothetical protein [Campylobacter sp. MIT 21-1685]